MDLLEIIKQNGDDKKQKQFIDNQLSKVGLDNEFIRALKKSRGEISGFFILRCMKKKWLNDSSIETDIDIFIQSSKKEKRIHKGRRVNFFGSRLKKDAEQLTPIENYLWKKVNYDEEKFNYNNYEEMGEGHIDIIREYKLEKVKVQVVHIFNDNIFDFIKKQFDFEFLMNSYDGGTLKIANINSIINEESKYLLKEDLRYKHAYYVKHYRCLKYLARGFKIINYEKLTQLIIDVKLNVLSLFGKHTEEDFEKKKILELEKNILELEKKINNGEKIKNSFLIKYSITNERPIGTSLFKKISSNERPGN